MRRFVSSTISCLCVVGLATAQNAALKFVNGPADTHIDVPYGTGLLPVAGITIEAWITYDDATLPSGQGARWPTIARHDVAAGGESYFLRIGSGSNNTLRLDWAVHNGAALQWTRYSFQPGDFAQWTHVAAVFDADAQSTAIYINGQLKSTGTATGPLRDNQGVLRIGNGDVANPGYEVWHGEIDEFRIWPFPRTQQEIASTMNTELQGIPGGISFSLNSAPYIDSSSGFIGTQFGTIAKVAGPMLVPAAVGSTSYGVATSTCAGRVLTSTSSLTANGNSAFAFQVYEAPGNAVGALFFAVGRLPNPLLFLGVQLNINPGSLFPVGASITSSAMGHVHLPWMIPANPGMVGVSLYAQALFVDATCGSAPFNLVASTGLEIKFQ